MSFFIKVIFVSVVIQFYWGPCKSESEEFFQVRDRMELQGLAWCVIKIRGGRAARFQETLASTFKFVKVKDERSFDEENKATGTPQAIAAPVLLKAVYTFLILSIASIDVRR